MAKDWWVALLEERERDGEKDANIGIFNVPYPITDEDPQNIEENEAYKRGFNRRRKELGAKFKWK